MWNNLEMHTVQVLMGRPEENKPLEKLRSRWKDNMKMVLKKVDCNARN